MSKKQDFLLSVIAYSINQIKKETKVNIYLEDDVDNNILSIRSDKTILYSVEYKDKDDAIVELFKSICLFALIQLSQKTND